MRKEEQDIEILEKLQEEQVKEQKEEFAKNAENTENITNIEEKESREGEKLAKQLAEVDAEKLELENRLGKVVDGVQNGEQGQVIEAMRQEILQFYHAGLTAYENGEKDRAIEILQKGVAVDRAYYLCWLGLLKVHTEHLQNLENFEGYAEVYDNCLLTMDTEKKAEVFAEYAEVIEQKMADYALKYQNLEREDEALRKQNQPKFDKRYKGIKLTFFIMLAFMLVSVTIMSISLPFYFVDKSHLLGYFALVAIICVSLFVLLFFIFAVLLTVAKKKKVLSRQIGSTNYGGKMRKIAQECEKYKIFVEDFAGNSE